MNDYANKVTQHNYAIAKLPVSNVKYKLLNIIKIDGGYTYIIIDPNGNETKGFSTLAKVKLMEKIKYTLGRLNSNNKLSKQELKSSKKGVKAMIKIDSKGCKHRMGII